MNKKPILFFLLGVAVIFCIAAMPTSVNFDQFGSGGVLYLTNNWKTTNGVFRGTNQFQTIQVTNGAGAGKVLTDVAGDGILSLQASAGGGTAFKSSQFQTNSGVVSLIPIYVSTNGIFTTNVLAATEYQIIPTGGFGSTNIPANYFSQSQVLELEFEGNMNDDAGSVNPTYRVYLGSIKIAEFISGSWSTGPENFTITTKFSCFRSGVTGSIRAVTKFLSEDPSAHSFGERYIVADYVNTSFDTTADYGIRVTVEFDIGIASEKITETKMVTIKGY